MEPLSQNRHLYPGVWRRRRFQQRKPLNCGVLILVLVLLIVAPLGAAAAEPEQRFILFNAEYNSSLKQLSKTTVFMEKRLFKLDTRTGETWVLIDVLQDGEDIRYWKKISNTQEK
jgi:hypothetical protein